MKRKHWLIPAIGACALGFLALPGQAAPVGAATSAGSDLRIAAGENAGVERVHRRDYGHYPHYGYYRPYHYHRYYRHRPGVHFYIGPRRHHRHHPYY